MTYDKLFIEIDKLDKWAQTQSDKSQDDIGGEWECNYDNWDNLYKAFRNFIATNDPRLWTAAQKERLLYIIARDNEAEYLSGLLNETAIEILTNEAIIKGHRDNKWQLAVQLHKLSDRQKALRLLENLVNDEEEYVSRRSLLEMGKLQSEKIEFYADKFWNKNKYGDLDQYQKIAVLHALKTVKSKQLDNYLILAKQHTGTSLYDHAVAIESDKNCS